jgi:nucleoside-diphosphate-sugar epimerase
MKTIFVTGINGLLGTNLVNLLLKNGYAVKGFVRRQESYQGMKSDHLELIQGTLFDDFSTVLKGVDYVIHLAAITRQDLLNYTDYWKVNCQATKHLYQAACQSEVKKFVFVSTANTLGHGSLDEPGSETKNMRQPFTNSFYAQSKKAAENWLLKNKAKIHTIMVNPTFMLGAYDTKPSSGRIILAGWKKKVVFYPPGGKNFVHVQDVAQGILNALKKGINGEKYLLANANLSYGDFFERMKSMTSQKTVLIQVPKSMLLIAGVLGSILRSLGIKTSISLINMRILCANNYFTNQKSVEELDLQYNSVDEAIKDAIAYFELHHPQKKEMNGVSDRKGEWHSK